jgi:hypothetical protein
MMMSVMPSPQSLVSESRAPFVFFEHVPAMSCRHGVYCMGLAAGRPLPQSNGKLLNELVHVGQIQGTREAMIELRDSINRILNVGYPARDPKSIIPIDPIHEQWHH